MIIAAQMHYAFKSTAKVLETLEFKDAFCYDVNKKAHAENEKKHQPAPVDGCIDGR